MKKKEIVICILAIIMLLVSMSNVFALGSDNLDDDDDEGTLTLADDNIINQIGQNVNNTVVDKENGIQQVRNNVNTSTNNMPNTGIADTPIIPIAICIVSAVVAYTQIRKYNV